MVWINWTLESDWTIVFLMTDLNLWSVLCMTISLRWILPFQRYETWSSYVRCAVWSSPWIPLSIHYSTYLRPPARSAGQRRRKVSLRMAFNPSEGYDLQGGRNCGIAPDAIQFGEEIKDPGLPRSSPIHMENRQTTIQGETECACCSTGVL